MENRGLKQQIGKWISLLISFIEFIERLRFENERNDFIEILLE